MSRLLQASKGLTSLMILGLLGLPAIASASLNPQPDRAIHASKSFNIAQGYYDSCPKAEPVRVYETRSFWVSICRGMDGELFYRGVNKRNREAAINISDVLVANDSTYRARNLPAKVFYDISPKELVVTQNGKVVLREAVIKMK